MTRETRNNLLFLALVIVLVSPGGVLLFRRMLRPGARPIGAADVVINTTAYMDPYASPGLERLAPAETLMWVDSVCLTDGVVKLARAGATTAPAVLAYRPPSTVGSEIPFKDVPLGNAAALVRSEEGYLHAVGTRQAVGSEIGIVRVMLWSIEPPLSVSVDGNDAVMTSRRVEVPKDVRHNLQNVGFIDPPTSVSIVDVKSPADARSIEIRFGKPGGNPKSDVLTLPISSSTLK